MKRIIRMTMLTFILLSLFGCSKNEPSVVKTYEVTDSGLTDEYWDNNKLVTMVKYYEMSDGTWKTDNYKYQYRLEITGRMNNAVKDSTYVFLSNKKDITFEQAWKASGLSSDMNDYYLKKRKKVLAFCHELLYNNFC